MENEFLNAQQMLAKIAPYIMLYFPIFHLFKTFKIVNMFPFAKKVHMKNCQIIENTTFKCYRYYVSIDY